MFEEQCGQLMESNIDKKMSKIVFLCCLFWFIAARLHLLHNCKQRDGEIRPGTGGSSQHSQDVSVDPG